MVGKNIAKIFLVYCLAFAFAAPILAQSRQTGSIHGKVIDTEGNVLPGCSLMLSGPKLLGTRSYTSSATGNFRFPSLPPGGDYEIKAEMPGFKDVTRSGLIVNVGRVTEIEIVMEMTTLEEEVTVTAASPVVDVETSKFSISYSSEFIASIPMNRDLYDIQNSIPGAISDEAEYRRTSSILGGTVRSTLYTLDGVPMNDPATFYSMANINVDVYDEIEVGIGALPAEIGQADSAHLNIVTKSGGNRYSGSVTGYYTGKELSQDLVSSDDQQALNVDKPESYVAYKDASLNLGGPILKDKIWFFLNGRRLIWDRINQYTPENRMANLGFDSPHYDLRHEEWLGFVKLTFQITRNIRYMGMLHYNHMYEPVYSNQVGPNYSYDYNRIWNHENTYTTTHQLNWVFNQNTFIDIRGNYIYRYFPIKIRPETEGNYLFYDRREDIYWGTSSINDENIRKKMIASVALTRFQDEWLGGSHELKAGIEFEHTEYHRDIYKSNPYTSYWRDYTTDNLYFYSSSRKEGRLRIQAIPDSKGQWDIQDHTQRFSAYIQDSVTAGKLAINLGLRFDFSYQYEPEQSRPEMRYDYPPPYYDPNLANNALIEALVEQWHEEIGPYSPFDALTTPYKRPVEFTTLSPRFGVVYDVFGNGKTALKLSFSQYYEPVWSAKYNSAQIFLSYVTNYYWYDDGNSLMDLPPQDTYRLTSIPTQDPEFSYYDENLKPPYTQEYLAGIEHELVKDFRLGLQFVYKRSGNIVEDIDKHNGYDPSATDEKGLIWIPYDVVDPGFDGEFGTDDDSPITIYGLRDDRPAPEWFGINPPEAQRKYWAGILTFSKRMSNNWQLEGSLLYSCFKGNAEATYSATEGLTGMFDHPTQMINSYGRDPFDRPWQIKLMSSVVLPGDWIFSGYFQHRSGSTWTRRLNRVYFDPDLDVQRSYRGVRAEEKGSRRNAPFTNMDLRVEKAFHFSENLSLNLYIDIFNLFGRSGANINQNPNGWLWYYRDPPQYEFDSQYGTITDVYGVRSIRLGARFNF